MKQSFLFVVRKAYESNQEGFGSALLLPPLLFYGNFDCMRLLINGNNSEEVCKGSQQ